MPTISVYIPEGDLLDNLRDLSEKEGIPIAKVILKPWKEPTAFEKQLDRIEINVEWLVWNEQK